MTNPSPRSHPHTPGDAMTESQGLDRATEDAWARHCNDAGIPAGPKSLFVDGFEAGRLSTTPTQPASPILGELVEALENANRLLAEYYCQTPNATASAKLAIAKGERAIAEYRSARTADEAGRVVVPAGWKLVPVEPTDEMQAAGWIDKEDVSPREIYWAMLAAAPIPQSLATTRPKHGAESEAGNRWDDMQGRWISENDWNASNATPTTNDTAQPVAGDGMSIARAWLQKDLPLSKHLHSLASRIDTALAALTPPLENGRAVDGGVR